MPDQQLPPCGIGGQSTSGGPCSGTYTPSQAGADAFSATSGAPVTAAILAGAAILAAVLFASWAVRKVAVFFGRYPPAAQDFSTMPGTKAYDDAFWAARGREANASMPDADFSDDYERAGELDMESDSETDDDGEVLRLDHDPQDDEEEDLESKPGADLSDEEFDRLEWREEWRRENGV